MKFTVLGCYGGYPYANVGTTSYLIESDDFHLLLDCGSGALIQLENKMDPLQLDAVLLTHYHHDHIADLGVLQYYWQLNSGKKKHPLLPLYGHDLDVPHFSALSMPDVSVGQAYHAGETLVLGPLELQFMSVHHPVPAFAVKITERKTNKVLVFTSDTAYIDSLAPFAQAADLLITDTNFLANRNGHPAHMTTQESVKVARDAQVKQLLLSHLPQEINHQTLLEEALKFADQHVPVRLAQKDLTIQL